MGRDIPLAHDPPGVSSGDERTLLLLASLGVLLSPLGSMFADSLLPSEQTETPTSVVQAADQLRDELSLLLPDPDAGWIPDSWSEFVGPMWRPIQQAVHPFQQLFRRDVTLADFCEGCHRWLLAAVDLECPGRCDQSRGGYASGP
jgi:hypothetical protein